MADNQRRRITFGILLIFIGGIVASIGLAAAIGANARDGYDSNSTNGIAALIGSMMFAGGVYLVIRFFQVRARTKS